MSIDYARLALPGLSGYDFSGIVDAMVQNYSLPLKRMQEKQSTLETVKNAWRDINTRLSALEKTLDKLSDSAVWSATAASSGNTDILTVTSSAKAVQGIYNVKVLNLAVAQTAQSEVLAVEDSSATTGIGQGTFSITVGENTKNIQIKAGASLDEIAAAVNNANAGVAASVIKVSGGYRLALISRNTGTEHAAVFHEVEGNVLHSLGILSIDEISGEDILNISQAAQDARLSINGIDEITSSTNQVTSAIPGLTLNLLSAAPDTTVTVKVSPNYQEAEAAVKAFVDQYNSVMAFIEDKVKYDKDTKIKGDLFGDPVLQGIQSRLRSILGGNLNNPAEHFKSLGEVGISTSGAGFGKSALLEFDTAKFRKAMSEHADSVANLFGARAGGITPRKESTGTERAEGLANILREYLHPMVMYQGSLDKTQENYQKQIDQVKKEIEDFNARVEAYAERVRLQFASLETMLAALDAERQWLSNQIKAMNLYKNDD
jgi:flagellar hook-associated protein 2